MTALIADALSDVIKKDPNWSVFKVGGGERFGDGSGDDRRCPTAITTGPWCVYRPLTLTNRVMRERIGPWLDRRAPRGRRHARRPRPAGPAPR